MEFALTQEQEMLQDQARSFLADKFSPERVAELAESSEGWDSRSWATMAELGWIGLSVPEDLGGAGMGFVEEAVLFEEMGRVLYPGPYWSTVALALPALQADPDMLGKVLAGEAAATVAWAEPSARFSLADLEGIGCKAESSNGEWRLTGDKHLVPDAAICDIVVVAARSPEGVGLWAVAGGDAKPLVTVDSTRRYGRLQLLETPATQLADGGAAPEVIARIRLRGLAGLALEAVGVAQQAFNLAAEYAKTRSQFDRPIGVYQAVSHRVADTFADVELARSLAYWAAWCVANDEANAATAVSAAKSFAADAAVAACERSIQVHGGMGFTWEHPLHRYYKRAQWIESFEGHGSTHRAAVAGALLDRN